MLVFGGGASVLQIYGTLYGASVHCFVEFSSLAPSIVTPTNGGNGAVTPPGLRSEP